MNHIDTCPLNSSISKMNTKTTLEKGQNNSENTFIQNSLLKHLNDLESFKLCKYKSQDFMVIKNKNHISCNNDQHHVRSVHSIIPPVSNELDLIKTEYDKIITQLIRANQYISEKLIEVINENKRLHELIADNKINETYAKSFQHKIDEKFNTLNIMDNELL